MALKRSVFWGGDPPSVVVTGSAWKGVGRCLAIAVVAAAVVSCSPEPSKKILFFQDIKPILNDKCAGCHFGGRTPINLTVENTYTDLMGGRYVVRHNAESSPVYRKLLGGHSSVNPLSPEQLKMIKLWIDDGAQNN